MFSYSPLPQTHTSEDMPTSTNCVYRSLFVPATLVVLFLCRCESFISLYQWMEFIAFCCNLHLPAFY